VKWERRKENVGGICRGKRKLKKKSNGNLNKMAHERNKGKLKGAGKSQVRSRRG
jgi:hypothetical protein